MGSPKPQGGCSGDSGCELACLEDALSGGPLPGRGRHGLVTVAVSSSVPRSLGGFHRRLLIFPMVNRKRCVGLHGGCELARAPCRQFPARWIHAPDGSHGSHGGCELVRAPCQVVFLSPRCFGVTLWIIMGIQGPMGTATTGPAVSSCPPWGFSNPQNPHVVVIMYDDGVVSDDVVLSRACGAPNYMPGS